MFTTDREFEDEVRRIARLLWPSAEFGGAEIVDNRERDGIFETEEFIHCIECTVSRQKDKANEDGNKLDKLLKRLSARSNVKFIKGWFITLNEPTADQRSVISKYHGRIIACSYDQFRSKLVDIKSYLTLRGKYPFGSVRDPKTNSAQFELDYIPLDMITSEGTPIEMDTLVKSLIQGSKYILLGDYGAGKSSTARELFNILGHAFWSGSSPFFPLVLNLRDHHGQVDPVEVLERHARNIAFSSPVSLVRAWRAGYCILILDGFDEIAAAGWAGITKKLRDLRYKSMELIGKFVRETPIKNGVILAGRAHFFDTEAELYQSMGVNTSYQRLFLGEFTSEQVESYLGRLGWKGVIPEWLPTRPLLLSYLYHKGLLFSKEKEEEASSPAVGWNELLNRIAVRESEIEAGIDPSTVRRLIESIATAARHTADSLGPLSPDTIIDCFKTVCGYAPDDRSMVLLQRLPGLGTPNADDGSRVFIDKDFVDAARSGDIFRYIESPYNNPLDCELWQSSLQLLGIEMVAFRCQQAGYTDGKLNAAIQEALRSQHAYTLAADLVLALVSLNYCYSGPKTFLKEVLIANIILEDATCNLGNLEFQDSVFVSMSLSEGIKGDVLPVFKRCYFARIEGRTGTNDIPDSNFVECSFEEFENTARTTNAIMALTLSLPCKVLLTMLKKLFAQSGTGRREEALYRGLDAKAKELVPNLLGLLRKEHFIVKSRQGANNVWLPAKTSGIRKRALSMLASPNSSNDPILDSIKNGI